MQIIFISYKESINSFVMDMLKSLDLSSYTKWPQVQDTPYKGRPRFGTHIWPGYNSGLLVPVPEEKVTSLVDKVKEYNDNTKFEGIKVYSWKLENVVE